MSDLETSGRETPDESFIPKLPRAGTGFGLNRQDRHGGAPRPRMVDAANRVRDIVEKPSTYAYKNINYDQEIRVLKIYPGKPKTPVVGRLVRCPLLDPGSQSYSYVSEDTQSIPYTALSYYWGDDKPNNKVYMFDSDEAHEEWKEKKLGPRTLRTWVGYLYIRDNLYAALERMRSERIPIYLWADALCINQKNITERTAQVSRMHDVYAQAEKVYIWLGEGMPEENVKAFRFLEKILDLEELEQLVKKLAEKTHPERPGALEDCKRTIDLMKADWFGRRWVIQELALATNAFVCRGDRKMPWPVFADAIALFMTKYDHIRRAFEGPVTYAASRNSDDHHIRALDARALGANALVTTTNNLFRRSNKGVIQQRLLSLEQLVSSMLLAFEATDPKDTVFAVLQIAKDNSASSLSKTKVHSISGAKKLLSHFGIPIVGVIWWNASKLVLQPTGIGGRPISEIALRNAVLNTRNGASVAISFCIQALSVLLIWMIYVKFLDTVVQGYNYITTGTRNVKPLDRRVEANYQKCLMDVCADFMDYCIEKSGSLDVLCRHWAPQPKPSFYIQMVKMPSWILPIEGHAFGGPKQARKGRVNGDSFVGGSERKSNYTASGNLSPSYSFGKTRPVEDIVVKTNKQEPGTYTDSAPADKTEIPPRFDGTLHVRGFQLGTIEESAPVVGHVISRAALELCGWSKETGSSDIEQLWRILVANRGPDGTNAPNWYRRACQSCLEWYNNQPEDPFNTDILKNIEGTPSGKVEFLDRVQRVTWNRNFVRVRAEEGKEFIAVTPPKSQVMDLVCILFGCSVPVVLRPILGTTDFAFVGECYVHGVMDGEAVDPVPASRWFKLR